MIKIYPDTRIYIHCPAGVVTGGAELLHQLANELNNIGRNAFIVYYGSCSHVTPQDYDGYNIKLSETIEDLPNNIEIIHEGIYNKLTENKYTQKILWWLSVDHFYNSSQDFLAIKDLLSFKPYLALKAIIKRIYKPLFRGEKLITKPLTIKYLKNINALHAYQSEYAQNFLQNHGFKEIIALKDYINTEHSSNGIFTEKEDIILYNPKKGLKFTNKLISASPNLKWIPLINMSREEVIRIMRKAKLYVDFGYHPGKDRLPRECAINGCCIITGMKGSAAFYEDIMIPKEYKFKEKETSIQDIISKIEYILGNYDIIIHEFSHYRKAIQLEYSEFKRQVNAIFGGTEI